MAGESLGTVRGQIVLDFKQAVAAYAATRAANAQTVYAMRGTSETFNRVSKGAAIAGLGIAAGIGLAVKAAAKFERKISFFGAVSDASTKDLDAIRKKALQLGQDTIYSAGQIADAFVELGKSGVSPALIIDGVGDAVAHLGAAADIDLPQAAQIITSAVQSFSLNGKDAIKVADQLAGAANASIVDVQDLGVSLKYVGGVAHALGLSFNETNTALALLGKYGIKGSTAGTSLRQILVSLTGNSKKAVGTLKDLGIITKNNTNLFFDQTGKVKPLSQVFQILQDHMKGMTKEQQVAAVKTIFNNRAMAAALDLTKAGAAGFKAMNAEVGKTTAAEVSAKRLDNLSGDVEILRGNLETLAITAGSPLQNFLRGIVQGVTRVVQAFTSLSPSTQTLILKTLAIVAATLLAVAAFTKVIAIGAGLVKAVKDLTAAFKFISFAIKVVRLNFALLTAVMAANPFILIAIGVAAIIVALILLYKHSARFRAIVQAIAGALVTAFKAVVNFFKGIPGFFVGLWNGIKGAFSAGVNAVVGFLKAWGPLILAILAGPLGLVIYAVAKFHTQIVGFFKSLPRVLGGLASAAVTAIVSFFAQLPARLGFIIGFVIGVWLRMWINIVTTAYSMGAAIVSFIATIPGRIAAFFVGLYTRAVAIWTALKNGVVAAALATYHGVINFFAALPGRVAAFFSNMYHRAVALALSLARGARSAASATVSGIASFFSALPGRVAGWFSSVYTKAKAKLDQMVTSAKNMAKNVVNGIKSGLASLPGVVGGALDKVIQAFKDLVQKGFNAAKDFAGGLWKGFKKGLGINSPSFIEKQMFQITKVTKEETDRLKGQVKNVQRVGSRLAQVSTLTPNNQSLTVANASATLAAARNLAASQKIAASLQKATSSITSTPGAQAIAANPALVRVTGPTTPSEPHGPGVVFEDGAIRVNAPANMNPDQVAQHTAVRVGAQVSTLAVPTTPPVSGK